MKKWDAATRDTLFRLVGDRDSWVRQQALESWLQEVRGVTRPTKPRQVEELPEPQGQRIASGESLRLLAQAEDAFSRPRSRRPPALRRRKSEQRLAGLELLRLLVEKKRAPAECRLRAEAYRASHPDLPEEEQQHLDAILDEKREMPKLDDALGLMGSTKLSPVVKPKPLEVVLCSAATMACLKSLDALMRMNKGKRRSGLATVNTGRYGGNAAGQCPRLGLPLSHAPPPGGSGRLAEVAALPGVEGLGRKAAEEAARSRRPGIASGGGVVQHRAATGGRASQKRLRQGPSATSCTLMSNGEMRRPQTEAYRRAW